MKSKKFILKIKIIDNTICLFLQGDKKNVVAKTKWKDKKDLSEKALVKINSLLKRKKISLENISQADFVSFGQCGFTARQIGEITVKIFNFGTNKLT